MISIISSLTLSQILPDGLPNKTIHDFHATFLIACLLFFDISVGCPSHPDANTSLLASWTPQSLDLTLWDFFFFSVRPSLITLSLKAIFFQTAFSCLHILFMGDFIYHSYQVKHHVKMTRYFLALVLICLEPTSSQSVPYYPYQDLSMKLLPYQFSNSTLTPISPLHKPFSSPQGIFILVFQLTAGQPLGLYPTSQVPTSVLF